MRQQTTLLGAHLHIRAFAIFLGHTKTIREYRGMRLSGLAPVYEGGKPSLAGGKESLQYVDSQ